MASQWKKRESGPGFYREGPSPGRGKFWSFMAWRERELHVSFRHDELSTSAMGGSISLEDLRVLLAEHGLEIKEALGGIDEEHHVSDAQAV